jgi:pSer/pThr/pTyr-binding forkhead associated (FHA) protein
MSDQIVLTVITGPHRNQSFVFDQQTRCLAGRAKDCQVRLSGNERDMQISRHHCLLEINPPVVRVSDLGSRNGTYINGRKVEPCMSCASGHKPKEGCSGSTLRDGDVLTIGGSSFHVRIAHRREGSDETVMML